MKTITLLWIGASLLAAQAQTQPQARAQAEQAAAKERQAQRSQRGAPSSGPAHPATPQARRSPSQTQKTAPPPPPAAASALPAIPAGATQVEPNLYRYTDAQGKTWLYRKTPFGVSKWEDTPTSQAPVPAAKDDTPVTVTDLGDRFRFERKTPFGAAKWERKKSELTSEEKQLVNPPGQAVAQSGNKAAEKQ